MQAKRNILVGKIGKTVKFTNNKIETGGGNDVLFISTLARMHPDWMLWIVGPNELYKIEGTKAYEDMFPAGNCKSLFACDKDSWEGRYQPILDNIKKEGLDGNIDCAVFFSGMASNVNVPGLLKKPDGGKYSILNSYLSYVAPYLVVLNETGCPFYIIESGLSLHSTMVTSRHTSISSIRMTSGHKLRQCIRPSMHILRRFPFLE